MLNTLLLVFSAFTGFVIACIVKTRSEGDGGAAVMGMLSFFGAIIAILVLGATLLFSSGGDRVTGCRILVGLIAYALTIILGNR